MRAACWFIVAGLALSACSPEDPGGGPSAADGGAGAAQGTTADLPDPLLFADGRRVTSKEQWPERRAEILELFRRHVYGRAPGAPEALEVTVLEDDAPAMGGAATLRRVVIKSKQAGREHAFELARFAPSAAKARGAFLLVSNRPARHTDPTRAQKSDFWPAEEIVARGYAAAAIQADAIAPDDPATFTSGVIRLFEGDAPGPRAGDAWKMIAAWSWGASRAMDYLVTDPRIDAARVAVVGHSRAGKAALWAGAEDERFSLVISNESGCAGAALSRRPVGETVKLVNDFFPHWFADAFRAYGDDEAALPVDQHMLVALLAPRAVAVGSASEDHWADPEGEYLGLAHASPVFALWGHAPVPTSGGWPAPGASVFVAPRGYHLRVGEHDLTRWDWDRYLDVADRVWGP